VVRRLSPLLVLASPIVPAVVEGDDRVSSSFHPRSTPRTVAREAGMGGVAIGSLLAGSARDPPYEQLLIRLGAGAGSMFHVGGGRHISVTWHRERGWLVLI
jgi:hypothetical protein